MKYLSVASGIEAASVAWEPLGFEPVAFAEIDAFPSAVLAHHYPEVPNAGDFTTITGDQYGPFDILVGGTPCQSFSVAGKRAGITDARGNLALEFIRLADRSRPQWVLWENVPGVLSSAKGDDFACFLSELTGVDVPVPKKGWKNSGVICGVDGHYSVAWRVLDAQYFGVPQRRRRLFLVGHLGDWRRAAAVLLEPESLLGHPPPSRETGQGFTRRAAPRVTSGGAGVVAFGGNNTVGANDVATGCRAHGSFHGDFESETFLVHAPDVATMLRSGPDSPASHGKQSGTDRETLVAFAQNTREEVRLMGGDGQVAGALHTEPGMHQQTFVAFTCKDHGEVASTMQASYDRLSNQVYGVIVPEVVGALQTHSTPNGHGMAGVNSQAVAAGHVIPIVAIQNATRGKSQNGLGITLDDPDPAMYTLDQGSQHAVAFYANDSGADAGTEVAPTLRSMELGGGNYPAVCFESRFVRNGRGAPDTLVPPLKAQSGDTGKGDSAPLVAYGVRDEMTPKVMEEQMPCLVSRREGGGEMQFAMTPTMAVRRLTPTECERLQGFPDGWTLVPHRGKPAADGPRYKAIGNSMAVPCMAWIGERIQRFTEETHHVQ